MFEERIMAAMWKKTAAMFIAPLGSRRQPDGLERVANAQARNSAGAQRRSRSVLPKTPPNHCVWARSARCDPQGQHLIIHRGSSTLADTEKASN